MCEQDPNIPRISSIDTISSISTHSDSLFSLNHSTSSSSSSLGDLSSDLSNDLSNDLSSSDLSSSDLSSSDLSSGDLSSSSLSDLSIPETIITENILERNISIISGESTISGSNLNIFNNPPNLSNLSDIVAAIENLSPQINSLSRRVQVLPSLTNSPNEVPEENDIVTHFINDVLSNNISTDDNISTNITNTSVNPSFHAARITNQLFLNIPRTNTPPSPSLRRLTLENNLINTLVEGILSPNSATVSNGFANFFSSEFWEPVIVCLDNNQFEKFVETYYSELEPCFICSEGKLKLFILPCCSKEMCESCLNTWFKKSVLCPFCKQDIREQ